MKQKIKNNKEKVKWRRVEKGRERNTGQGSSEEIKNAVENSITVQQESDILNS